MTVWEHSLYKLKIKLVFPGKARGLRSIGSRKLPGCVTAHTCLSFWPPFLAYSIFSSRTMSVGYPSGTKIGRMSVRRICSEPFWWGSFSKKLSSSQHSYAFAGEETVPLFNANRYGILRNSKMACSYSKQLELVGDVIVALR